MKNWNWEVIIALCAFSLGLWLCINEESPFFGTLLYVILFGVALIEFCNESMKKSAHLKKELQEYMRTHE